MFKRIVAVAVSLALLFAIPSCDLIGKLRGAIESVIGVDDSKINRHEYTAEAYEFPTKIGEFVSLDRKEYLCYKNLTTTQKTAYDYMYDSALKMDKALFYVGECTAQDVAVAFHALTYDCPYLIWLPSSYGVSEQKKGTFVSFVDSDGKYGYSMTPTQRDLNLDMLYNEVNLFITQNLLPDMTDYEIELAVHDWLCNQITYNKEAADSVKTYEEKNYAYAWTPFGSIVKDSAVCAGYARSLQMVLNYVGIECGSLRVKSKGEMHMVCIANIDDKWVYVDPTWNDKEACGLIYTHDYFNLTYEEMKSTHNIFEPWENVLEKGEKLNSNFNIYLPQSDSEELNYYKVQGLQINSESEFKQKIVSEFVKAIQRGETSLEFQFTYCQSSNELIDQLIDKYDIIKEIGRRTRKLKSIQYASLNNGAFSMSVKFK